MWWFGNENTHLYSPVRSGIALSVLLCPCSELELHQSLIPRITAPARVLDTPLKARWRQEAAVPTAAWNSSPRLCTNPFSLFSHPVTPTDPTPGAADSVHFLGLDLTSQSAEIALYVLFALSAVGALGLVLFAFKYRKLSKRSHKRSHIELSSKM